MPHTARLLVVIVGLTACTGSRELDQPAPPPRIPDELMDALRPLDEAELAAASTLARQGNEAAEDDAPDGDAPDGDAPDGDAPDGDAPDGTARPPAPTPSVTPDASAPADVPADATAPATVPAAGTPPADAN